MESNCKVYDLFENIWKTLHEGNIMQDIVLHNVLKVLKNILELWYGTLKLQKQGPGSKWSNQGGNIIDKTLLISKLDVI